MNLGSIKPTSDWVFLQAIEEEVTEGGIIIPLGYRERFPQTGWIIASGPDCYEEFKQGDIAILVNEGLRTDNTYWAVCSLTLKDWPTIEHCDVEVWPVVKEAVDAYRENPSTHDRWVHVKTIDSQSLSFLTSDVLDCEVSDLSDAGLKLDYVNAVMLEFEREGLTRLFYFVRESDILATIGMD